MALYITVVHFIATYDYKLITNIKLEQLALSIEYDYKFIFMCSFSHIQK